MKFWTFLFLLMTIPLRAAEPAFLQLHMDREPREVHPQHDRLGYRIQINRPDGSPVHAARVHVRLQAPPTPWLASTDFPVVEGSVLFDSDVQIDRGEFTFAFVPPIRGVYTLNFEVSPLLGDSSFAPSQQQWQTEILENPAKQRNLSVLIFILVALGGASGYIIARGVFTGERALTALALLVIIGPFVLPQRVEAHGDEHAAPHETEAPKLAASEQGDRLEIELQTPHPRVGELASISARLLDANGQPQPARFRLRFTQLEHGIEVFATEAVAADGVFRWNGQFYDGSDHRVDIQAVRLALNFDDGKPASSAQVIEVEAISPPSRAVWKSFGFLMLVTAGAMFFGIMLSRVLHKSEDYSY